MSLILSGDEKPSMSKSPSTEKSFGARLLICHKQCLTDQLGLNQARNMCCGAVAQSVERPSKSSGSQCNVGLNLGKILAAPSSKNKRTTDLSALIGNVAAIKKLAKYEKVVR